MSKNIKQQVISEIKEISLTSWKKIVQFFDVGGIQWESICVVYTDGASAMLGFKSGFQVKMKRLAPQALVCKMLLFSLKKILEIIIKIVNFINIEVLSTRIFK